MHKKFMRRIIFLLAVVLMISCGSMVYADTVDSGSCGENLTWELTSDGTLIISGDGSMGRYSTFPWEEYRFDVTSVIINNGVTSIKSYAFDNFGLLTNISIADTVVDIGHYAFRNCASLKKINLPESITVLEDGIFDECTNLEQIRIPSGVTEIGQFAFTNCKVLKSIQLPHNLKSIGDGAFSNCESLTDIDIPIGIKSIGRSAFSGCKSLTTVTIPGTVEILKEHTFFSCDKLKEVVLSEGIKQIEDNVFIWTELSSITIPESVVIIGENAINNNVPVFCHKNSVALNYVINNNIPYVLIGGSDAENTISGNSNTFTWKLNKNSGLLTVVGSGEISLEEGWSQYAKLIRKVELSEGITAIGWSAFSGYTNLSYITIPDSLQSIGFVAFSDSKITELSLPLGVGYVDSVILSGMKTLNSITFYNRECTIASDIVLAGSSATVYGFSGSTAETYALNAGYKFISLDGIHKHVWGNQPEVVAPTCQKEGYSIYTCMQCDYQEKQNIVSLLGHKAGELKVTVKATATKEGQKVSKCTACNEVVKTVVISPAKVTLSKAGVNFTGKKVKAPIVRVKTAAGKVIPAKYYTVKAPKNVKKMKDIGRYTYTINFKANCPDYKGTVKLHFEIKPAKTTIKAPAASKKAITVKWAKGKKAQVTGYDILLATDKKFSKNKKTITVKGVNVTSKKVTKLKAKTKYYVKVRTYKTVKGVKIYSDWSKVKTIRTK